MRIDVLTLCPSRFTRDDGAILVAAIRAAWASGCARPVVDFGGEMIASIGFLDEIALLANGGIYLQDHLDIVGMTAPDRALLDDFIQHRLATRRFNPAIPRG